MFTMQNDEKGLVYIYGWIVVIVEKIVAFSLFYGFLE